jgi:hypothetical protein
MWRGRGQQSSAGNYCPTPDQIYSAVAAPQSRITQGDVPLGDTEILFKESGRPLLTTLDRQHLAPYTPRSRNAAIAFI